MSRARAHHSRNSFICGRRDMPRCRWCSRRARDRELRKIREGFDYRRLGLLYIYRSIEVSIFVFMGFAWVFNVIKDRVSFTIFERSGSLLTIFLFLKKKAEGKKMFVYTKLWPYAVININAIYFNWVGSDANNYMYTFQVWRQLRFK